MTIIVICERLELANTGDTKHCFQTDVVAPNMFCSCNPYRDLANLTMDTTDPNVYPCRNKLLLSSKNLQIQSAMHRISSLQQGFRCSICLTPIHYNSCLKDSGSLL